ncbi:MAG: histidine phosphatase family protein [Thiolinea sp.]
MQNQSVVILQISVVLPAPCASVRRQDNEAGLPAADWKIIKLSPKIWSVLFRILWLSGYPKNSESFKAAKSRASDAAEKLTEIAQQHDSVLFVGHGVFNRILANELRRQGWSGPKNPGSVHWAFGVYER